MGVAGLLSFIQEHLSKFSVPLNLSQEAKAEKLNIIVDGYGLLYFFLERYRVDWLNGGRYADLYDLLAAFIRKFQQQNIHLIFIFDGLVDRAKKETSLERRVSEVKEAAKIWTDNSAASAWTRILPFFFEHIARVCIKAHGAEVYVSTYEADFDIGQLCLTRKIFAILANDSDFFIFSIPSYYISFKNLDIDLKSDTTPALTASSESTTESATTTTTTTTTTATATATATETPVSEEATSGASEERKPGDLFARGFKAEKTAKLLNFPPEILPVFACLAGNDTTRHHAEVKSFQQSILPPKSKARSHDVLIAVSAFLSARYGNPAEEAKEGEEKNPEAEPAKEKEDPMSAYNFDFFNFTPATKNSLQSVAKKYFLCKDHELEEKRKKEENEHLKMLALRAFQLAPPARKRQEKKGEQQDDDEESEEEIKKAQEAEANRIAEEEKAYQSELAKYNESPLVQEIRNRVQVLIEDMHNSRGFSDILMVLCYQEFWGSVLLEDLAQNFVNKNCFHSLTPLRQRLYGSIFNHPGIKGSESFFVNEYIPIMGIASTNKVRAVMPQKNNQSLLTSVSNTPEAKAEHFLSIMECNTKLMNTLLAPAHFGLLLLCTSLRAVLKYHPNVFFEWELEAFLASILYLNETRKVLVLPQEEKKTKDGKPETKSAPEAEEVKAEGEQKESTTETDAKEGEGDSKSKKKKKQPKKEGDDDELLKKELSESTLVPVARKRASLLFALFQGALFHSYIANQVSDFHTIVESDMVEFLLDGRLWHAVYAVFSRHFVVSRDSKKAAASATPAAQNTKLRWVEKANSNQVLKKIRKLIVVELNGQIFKNTGGGAPSGGAGRGGKHPASVKSAAKASAKKSAATANRFSVLG